MGGGKGDPNECLVFSDETTVALATNAAGAVSATAAHRQKEWSEGFHFCNRNSRCHHSWTSGAQEEG